MQIADPLWDFTLSREASSFVGQSRSELNQWERGIPSRMISKAFTHQTFLTRMNCMSQSACTEQILPISRTPKRRWGLLSTASMKKGFAHQYVECSDSRSDPSLTELSPRLGQFRARCIRSIWSWGVRHATAGYRHPGGGGIILRRGRIHGKWYQRKRSIQTRCHRFCYVPSGPRVTSDAVLFSVFDTRQWRRHSAWLLLTMGPKSRDSKRESYWASKTTYWLGTRGFHDLSSFCRRRTHFGYDLVSYNVGLSSSCIEAEKRKRNWWMLSPTDVGAPERVRTWSLLVRSSIPMTWFRIVNSGKGLGLRSQNKIRKLHIVCIAPHVPIDVSVKFFFTSDSSIYCQICL